MIFCSDLGEAYLKIIGVTTEDDGIYTCIAANDMGSISTSASLRVLGPGSDGIMVTWKDNFDSLYSEVAELGRGRFSVIKRYDQKGTKREVAAKFVNKKLMKRDQVTRELGIMQNLQHPQLVGLLDTFETSTSYILVLEMANQGRLLDYIVQWGNLTEGKIKLYLREILEAVHYLHNCRIVHLDLKPENILVDKSLAKATIRLADFGDAVQLNTTGLNGSCAGASGIYTIVTTRTGRRRPAPSGKRITRIAKSGRGQKTPWPRTCCVTVSEHGLPRRKNMRQSGK